MWIRLSNISQYGMGQTVLTKDMIDEGVPVYSATISDAPLGFIPKSTNKINLSYGDLVVPARGNSIGYVTFVKDLEASCTQTTIWMKLYFKSIVNYLLCYFRGYKDKLFVFSGGAIPQVTISMMQNYFLPLPPLEEQQRIVDKINSFEPLLQEYEGYEKKLTALESTFADKLKKSILQHAIEGKLVKQDPNDEPASVLLERIKAEKEKLIKEGKIKRDKNESYIYQGDDKNYYENLPSNWVLIPFEKLCKTITCGYASTPKYESNGIPFISARNVKPYRFIFKDYKYVSIELFKKIHPNNSPEKGDILLTRVGAGIGEACIIDVDETFGIYVSVTLIKLVDKQMNEYILHVLESPYGLSLSNYNTYGKDASQGNLNVNNVRQFICPIPPINEQKRIIDKIRLLNLVIG